MLAIKTACLFVAVKKHRFLDVDSARLRVVLCILDPNPIQVANDAARIAPPVGQTNVYVEIMACSFCKNTIEVFKRALVPFFRPPAKWLQSESVVEGNAGRCVVTHPAFTKRPNAQHSGFARSDCTNSVGSHGPLVVAIGDSGVGACKSKRPAVNYKLSATRRDESCSCASRVSAVPDALNDKENRRAHCKCERGTLNVFPAHEIKR